MIFYQLIYRNHIKFNVTLFNTFLILSLKTQPKNSQRFKSSPFIFKVKFILPDQSFHPICFRVSLLFASIYMNQTPCTTIVASRPDLLALFGSQKQPNAVRNGNKKITSHTITHRASFSRRRVSSGNSFINHEAQYRLCSCSTYVTALAGRAIAGPSLGTGLKTSGPTACWEFCVKDRAQLKCPSAWMWHLDRKKTRSVK